MATAGHAWMLFVITHVAHACLTCSGGACTRPVVGLNKDRLYMWAHVHMRAQEEHAHGAGEATLVSPVPPDLAPPFTPIGIITIGEGSRGGEGLGWPAWVHASCDSSRIPCRAHCGPGLKRHLTRQRT